jgi:hypothetical protein
MLYKSKYKFNDRGEMQVGMLDKSKQRQKPETAWGPRQRGFCRDLVPRDDTTSPRLTGVRIVMNVSARQPTSEQGDQSQLRSFDMYGGRERKVEIAIVGHR